MRAIRTTAVIAVLTAVLNPLWAQSLVQNPGFEEVGGDGRPVAWSLGGKAELVTDSAAAHSGKRCVKGRFEDGLSQSVPLQGGQSYQITGWIRRVDPAGVEVPKIKVYFSTAEGKDAGVQATEFPNVPATGWVSWESVMRAPNSATTMNLTLRGFFGGSEFFYWDDLSVGRVVAPDWPAWKKTPDLNGKTVRVPDLADVITEAVMRWFSVAWTPMDGQLDTSAISRGQDFVVKLRQSTPVNYMLVHTLQPLNNLCNARVWGIGASREKELFRTGSGMKELVTSEQFATTALRQLRIEVPKGQTVCMNEIQVFNVEPRRKPLPGIRRALRLQEGAAPEAFNRRLQLVAARAEDRGVLLAGDGAPVTAQTINLKAGTRWNIVTNPPVQEHAVSGLSLSLALRARAPETQIELAMMQAEELDLDVGEAELVDRVGSSPGNIPANRREPRLHSSVFRLLSRVPDNGSLVADIDIPDTLFAAGEPVWITVKPQRDVTLDLSQSAVALYAAPKADALAEYAPRLERLLWRFHAQGTEAHAWGSYQSGYMGRYLRRVLELKPDSRVGAPVWSHVGGRRRNVKIERPGPANAPDWAVWAHLALNNMHHVVEWWLDNRQRSDGQLGGHINDDCEFSCRWPTDYLITGDPRVRGALQKLADVAWAMSGGKGYTVGSTDVEHAAEDQSCTQPQVLLTHYGSPGAMERLMVMSLYLNFWTAINPVGRRQFKSFMFNADRLWEEPPYDVDHAYCPLAMVGAGHAVWYANLPDLRGLFLEEAESWRLATLSTDKGKAAGVIPHEVSFRDSGILPYAPYTKDNPLLKNRDSLYMGGAGQYIIVHLLNGATSLTGDDKFAAPLKLTETPDADKLKIADRTLALFNQTVQLPPEGPEKRYAVTAPQALEVRAPLRAVREGEALGATTEDGLAGGAGFKVTVPESGRYAVWALVGRADAKDKGVTSFFADFNGLTDRLVATVEPGGWTSVVGRQAFDLKAGEQIIHLRVRTAGSALKEIGFTNKYGVDGTWSASQDETKLYEVWKLTGDRKWLVEELKEVVRQQERTRWLSTEAEPFTDRVYWPGEPLLANLYLGGTTAQKSHVPLNWISWEGGGTDFAALVLDAKNDHLKALCYSFAKEARPMKMRSWRLPHGRYQVTVGLDRNGDDEAEQTLQNRTMNLTRYEAVEFKAEPGRCYVIELTLVEKLEDVTGRPDLAMDLWDVRMDDKGALQVTMHNIGGSASPATTVRVIDGAGKSLGEAQVPALEPPLDLRPRTATVTVRLLRASPKAGTRVVVDPDGKVAEITEVNNSVAFRYSSVPLGRLGRGIRQPPTNRSPAR